MWQLLTPFRKRLETGHTVRPRRRCRPQCKSLEDRCLLSVSLSSSGPTVPLVGSPVNWTATASGHGTTPVYEFSVTPPGGASQMVRDFSLTNSFVWNPMQEGSYSIQVTVKDSFSALTGESTSVSYTADSRAVGTSAVISPTSNPLVALYSAPPSSGTSMYVQFAQLGPNPTWSSTTPQSIVPGESSNFIVAGMLPNTTYLMRNVLSDGTVSAPLAFTTGSVPDSLKFPTYTAVQSPSPASDPSQGMIFHDGIANGANAIDTLATDRFGNVNWYYDQVSNSFPSFAVSTVPGGTVLLLGGPVLPAAEAGSLREIDLAGDSLRETNIDAINAQLAAMGQNQITALSHDAQRLPNGDTAVIAATPRVVNVNGTPTNYKGDMVIVLDQNFQVAWVWDAFKWLDTNRLPALGDGPADWTHSNAVAWSPEDGDLLVSVRNQSWVIKIDYSNGSGDGHVIWRLGQDGDFTIKSSDPSPWFSYQHDSRYINDTTINVYDDGNVRQASDPNAKSRGQELVLDEKTMTATLVVNADLGVFTPAVGSAQTLPNGNLAFNAGIILTKPAAVSQSIEVLPNGTKIYVLQQPGLQYRSYFMSTLYGTPADMLDAGFESPIQGTGQSAYQYDPTGSAWSFSGGAGLAGNGSGFTSGNPNAPQASQVAFIQGTGKISQVMDFSLAGTYQISLSAAQRANFGTSKEQVQVLVDGTAVGTITPTSTNYFTYSTASFNVTAGSHTISFIGIDPSGADYSAFLDQVSINTVSPAGFTDPGFEVPSQGAGASAYHYRPTGSAWSFSGGAGLSGNGSGFTAGNPNAPQGGQVAFIQGTGKISQAMNFSLAGTYQISLSAAQRANFGTSKEAVQVLVDSTVVSTFTPTSTSYSIYTTASFSVTAGSHTISFVGVDPSGADYSAFLDQVSIDHVSSTGSTDPGFEIPSLGSGASAYQYDPTGSAWSFSGQAGLSGNGSIFTSGNPNAPQGSQVAFIQGSGTISQAVNVPATGSYLISFTAAQRENNGTSNEAVQVQVDGTVVGIFTPASTNYSTYTTASFNVASGSHTITFVGVDPSGADYSAFLDQVSINTVSPSGFTDPSLEIPSLGSGPSAYKYDPTGSAWSFSGGAGLSGNGSGFTAGNPSAPQGSQVAFIQGPGKISQVVNVAAAGSYLVSLSAAQRANFGTSKEQVQVLLDGTAVGTITPTSTNYSIYTTASFSVTAGSHTISFVGVDPSGADYTAFVDQVSILLVG